MLHLLLLLLLLPSGWCCAAILECHCWHLPFLVSVNSLANVI